MLPSICKSRLDIWQQAGTQSSAQVLHAQNTVLVNTQVFFYWQNSSLITEIMDLICVREFKDFSLQICSECTAAVLANLELAKHDRFSQQVLTGLVICTKVIQCQNCHVGTEEDKYNKSKQTICLHTFLQLYSKLWALDRLKCVPALSIINSRKLESNDQVRSVILSIHFLIRWFLI